MSAILPFPDKRRVVHVDFTVKEGLRGGIDDWKLDIYGENASVTVLPEYSPYINEAVINMFSVLLHSLSQEKIA